MDQTRPKRRFRFGLRSLLLLVALCAVIVGIYCYRLRLLPYEVQQLYGGMTPAEALDSLGKPMNFDPSHPLRPSRAPFRSRRLNDPSGLGDYWIWQFDWGQIDMRFDQQDRCCFIEYYRDGADHWETHFGSERP